MLFLRDGRATLMAALAIPVVAAGGVRGHPGVPRLAEPDVARRYGHRGRPGHRRRGGRRRGHPSRAGARGSSPQEAARRQRQLLAGPVVSSTLTTVVVFAPLGFLSGVVGAFFAALALALAAAVLLSLVIALTVIPLLWPGCSCDRRSRRTRTGWGRATAAGSHGRCRGGGWWSWRSRWLVLLGGAGRRRVETGFIPEMDEGAYVLDYFAPARHGAAGGGRGWRGRSTRCCARTRRCRPSPGAWAPSWARPRPRRASRGDMHRAPEAGQTGAGSRR